MNADSPFDGNGLDDGDEPSYEWLDEWLCEYVDGTMDPSLEAVFETYVEANPELKAHVERLKKTRELLCNCGLPRASTPDVETEAIGPEEPGDRPPASGREPERVGPVATVGLVSSVATALVVGFLVGAMVVGPPPSADVPSASGPVREMVGTEAPFSEERLQVSSEARPFAPLHSPAVVPDSAQAPSTLIPIARP